MLKRSFRNLLGTMLLSALPALSDEPLAVPILVLEPGAHTSAIVALASDRAGRIAATASIDGTVRIWDVAGGTLLRTLRLPRGADHIGKAFAVALSPDGHKVAIGGWTRWSETDPQEQVYVYDIEDGSLSARLDGLPNVTLALAFSPDGRRLAAGFGGSGGVRMWQDTGSRWLPIGPAISADARSSALDFAPDGRLAAASYDGTVRLYDAEGVQTAERVFARFNPTDVAFSPDGTQIAVAFADEGHVSILAADTLADRGRRDDQAEAEGGLDVLAWTDDGLYAAGSRRMSDETADLLLWADSGLPKRFEISHNTVTGLAPVPGGNVVVAAADPLIASVSPEGAVTWDKTARKMDFRDQHDTFSVSDDGLIVDFAVDDTSEPLRFDVGRLSLGPVGDPGLTLRPARLDGRMTDWNDSREPTLDGSLLRINPAETSRSVAVSPRTERIFLGTDWNLRAYDMRGMPLWTRPVPSAAWAVNATANGQLVVGAYGDGTIRWHRADDGIEILALFVRPGSRDWVVWTPEGIYASTPGARSVLRWHVNRGWDAPAEAIPVHMVPNTLRPEVIPHVLPKQGTPGALAVAELAEIRESVKNATGSPVAPGAVLHVLAIGVGDYNDAFADHLDLDFADRDAEDFARALVDSQSGLYATVNPMLLRNEQATAEGILRGLATLREIMSRGDGSDLAVVYYSGHGAIINDDFYLLPHDVDTRDPVRIATSAINAIQVQREISQMSRFGRVLVLMDTCRSGASTVSGQGLDTNGDLLKSLMQGPNISVLNSSSADEDSIESAEWENGAFTEVVLEAINGHAADMDANGVLTITEMTGHLSKRVPQITSGRQTPSVEVRYESAVFVVGP